MKRREWKQVMAFALSLALVFPTAMPVRAEASDDIQDEQNAENAVQLEISGLTDDGKLSCGDSVTFGASGGTNGDYYLEMTVDGNSVGARIMKNGEITLRSGQMDNIYEDYVLPIGSYYTAKVFRYNWAGEKEYSSEREFEVIYDSPEQYSFSVKGAARIDIGREQWSLDEVPVVYRDGEPYKSLFDLGAVIRYLIYDEKSGELVSQDGMVEAVGYYTVNACVLFEDEETGEVVKINAKPVRAKILSDEIVIDPDMLDGGNPGVESSGDGGETVVPPQEDEDVTDPSEGDKDVTDPSEGGEDVADPSEGGGEAVVPPIVGEKFPESIGDSVFTVMSVNTDDSVSDSVYVGEEDETSAPEDSVEASSYRIRYRLRGGSNNPKNPESYSDKDVKLKKPARKGYIFKGWYTDKKCANRIKKISADGQKNVTVYAKWKKVKKSGK